MNTANETLAGMYQLDNGGRVEIKKKKKKKITEIKVLLVFQGLLTLPSVVLSHCTHSG